METKILLCKNGENNMPIEKVDGYYLKAPTNLSSDLQNFELFIDVRSLSPNEVMSESVKFNNQNAVFIIDDIKAGVFIKAVNANAKISFYSDVYSDDLIAFLSVNKFDLTIKYTCLAPERIQKLQSNGIKINGVFLSRFDEAEILKFWKVDYFTILPEIK